MKAAPNTNRPSDVSAASVRTARPTQPRVVAPMAAGEQRREPRRLLARLPRLRGDAAEPERPSYGVMLPSLDDAFVAGLKAGDEAARERHADARVGNPRTARLFPLVARAKVRRSSASTRGG